MRVAYAGETDSVIARVWIDEMRKRGVDPVVVAEVEPAWDVEWQPLVVPEPPVKGIGIGRILLRRAVHEALESAGVDLLHWHTAGARVWGRFHHPFVVSPWGSDVLLAHERSADDRQGVGVTLRAADAVFCCAEHVRDAAVALGAQPARCELIGWGVDTSVYRPDEVTRARIRAEWGIPAGATVILTTRRLEPLYRHSLLIEAMRVLVARDPSFHLVVASYGTLENDLRRQAWDLGLADNVHFLGRIPESGWPSMPDVYRGGDVYCSIPQSDGAPLSVLEAMATGLPVVASDLPSMQDWVEGPGAGSLLAEPEPDSLASLLSAVASARYTFGRAARRFTLEYEERRMHMDRAVEAYGRLVRRIQRTV